MLSPIQGKGRNPSTQDSSSHEWIQGVTQLTTTKNIRDFGTMAESLLPSNRKASATVRTHSWQSNDWIRGIAKTVRQVLTNREGKQWHCSTFYTQSSVRTKKPLIDSFDSNNTTVLLHHSIDRSIDRYRLFVLQICSVVRLARNQWNIYSSYRTESVSLSTPRPSRSS